MEAEQVHHPDDERPVRRREVRAIYAEVRRLVSQIDGLTREIQGLKANRTPEGDALIQKVIEREKARIDREYSRMQFWNEVFKKVAAGGMLAVLGAVVTAVLWGFKEWIKQIAGN